MQALMCTGDQPATMIEVSALSSARSTGGVSLVELGKKLLVSAKTGDTEQVRNLMTKGAPFTTDWLGTSPLHLAAQYGHTDTAEVLLRAGISRDARTKVDRTPLHIAAQEGHTPIVLLLLGQGADIEAKDMLKMTPLHWAVEREHIGTIEVLLQHGADPYAVSKFEKNAFNIAGGNNRPDIFEILQTSERYGPFNRRASQHEVDSATLAATKSLAVELAHVPAATHQEEVETSVGDANEARMISPGIHEIFVEANVNDLHVDKESEDSSEKEEAVSNIPTMQLLQAHGITMLPTDNSTIVASAVESGQTVVLTEAGKLALNLTRTQLHNSVKRGVMQARKAREGSQKVITIMADQLVSMAVPQSNRSRTKSVDQESPLTVKKITLSPAQSTGTTVSSSSQSSANTDELAAITQQLEEARRVAEEYREQLRRKEHEAEEYKKQLQSITRTPTK